VKLLFDQNLSRKLPAALADIFPDSIQVLVIGLAEADDVRIWEHARENGFVVVSKDSDFQQRSLLLGHPPKFIWLRVGNCTTRDVEKLLRAHSASIHTFEADAVRSHLILP
jgi:predicted nuclease of predicted toxin-antitoxin system